MVATLDLRRRIRIGPALRIVPLPVASLTLSTGLHLGLMVAIVLAVHAINRNQPQAIVVNLVPAVAAMGSPRGEAAVPPAPPAPSAKAELPDRSRDLPTRDLPSRERSRDPMALPERGSLPPRSTAPSLPRPDQKELPTLPTGSASTQGAPAPPASAPTRPTTTQPTQTAAATPPPQPLGQATGSPKGAGKVTLEVDFPYSWYLAAIHRKISERWDEKALKGNQPVVVFEIGRDGQVNLNTITVETTSGNSLYDRAAIRAIQEANPFPPLPADFKQPLLRIHLGFAYSRG